MTNEQWAVLAILGLEVYTVERIGDLLRQARKRLRQLGMNVRSKHDDGRIGWAEHGPYDGIIVTAAAPELPGQLSAALQLAFQRPPEPGELDALLAHAREHGLENTCRVILNLNEFVFVD